MNPDKTRLLLSEYGRNVQTMVYHLRTIEDRVLRNRQAEVVVAVMGNVNPRQKDSEGFQQMLWDHLFVIADFDLDVDSPYPKSTPDMFAPNPDRIEYPQAYIPQKQYGNNVRRMLEVLSSEPMNEDSEAVAVNIAKFMKQKSFEYNKEFPSNEVVIRDIARMSKGDIVLDDNTLDNTRIDTSSVVNRTTTGRNNSSNNNSNNKNNNRNNSRNNNNDNSGGGGNSGGFQHKKYTKRAPSSHR